MFDSQKLSFEKFAMGYKHGVYIITKDACGVCQQYKEDIKWVNNRYLYFVEAANQEDVRLAKQLHDRLAFPITAGWKDNQLVWVRLGEQYGEDFNRIMDWLKQFGDAPLSPEDLKDRIEKFNARCVLSFYIFNDGATQEQKDSAIAGAYARHELPVDIDTVAPMMSMTERINMLLSYVATAKFVLWGPDGDFSPMKVALLGDYLKMAGHPVEVRELNGKSKESKV